MLNSENNSKVANNLNRECVDSAAIAGDGSTKKNVLFIVTLLTYLIVLFAVYTMFYV